MSTWTDGREDAGIPRAERSAANTIPRGCPKDHGDMVFAFESLAYECRTCDYSQTGLTPKPSDLVVARKEPAEERAYVSLPALRERWGLDDRALRRKLRNNNIAIEVVRGESVVRGDLVARFDRHESYRPPLAQEPGARSQEPGEEEEPMAESNHANGPTAPVQSLALVETSPIEDPDELLTLAEIAALWGCSEGAARARLEFRKVPRHAKDGRIAHRRGDLPDVGAIRGSSAPRPRGPNRALAIAQPTPPTATAAPVAVSIAPGAPSADPARVARLRLAIREMVARADSRLDILPVTQLEVIYALGSLAIELDDVGEG